MVRRSSFLPTGRTHLFDPTSVGLLVVDVQTRLWPHIHAKEAVLKRVVQAIEVAGHMELPILVTEQYVKGLGRTIPAVREALGRFKAYNPIEKFAFSCLGCPEFASELAAAGLHTIVVVGIEAHVCCMQTTLDALGQGFEVFYIAEATGSRDRSHKEEAIHRVRDAGAIVGSVEMFAFEAMRGSKHSAFKHVQKVIV